MWISSECFFTLLAGTSTYVCDTGKTNRYFASDLEKMTKTPGRLPFQALKPLRPVWLETPRPVRRYHRLVTFRYSSSSPNTAKPMSYRADQSIHLKTIVSLQTLTASHASSRTISAIDLLTGTRLILHSCQAYKCLLQRHWKFSSIESRTDGFLSNFSPEDPSSINASSYLHFLVCKESVWFKARQTLGGAHIGFAKSVTIVYHFFKTSVRRSARYRSATVPFQSFCALFLVSLPLFKIPCSFTAAAVPYIYIISRKNSIVSSHTNTVLSHDGLV